MVQLVNSGSVKPDSESWKLPVKLEVEDPLDEKHGPLNKRFKFSAQCDQPLITGENKTIPDMALYNPLNEPSPLGLQLRKTPSLVDLIQMRLSQANATEIDAMNGEHLQLGKEKDAECTAVSATTEKLKASNFPASLLRIGTWECVSRYEGDLVAKCYFAKHKLVWEVLEGGLKSKIEIQWSDIIDLKATCPENGPGTLVVVLARPPLFFKETNPQPRKHTLWHATSDFTCGQASLHRRHLLQCPQGLLSKHLEKLIQCDPRLNLLNQQPEMPLDSPYFESRLSVLAEQDEAKGLGFNLMKTEYIPTFSSFQDSPSPCAAQSSSAIEMQDPVSRVLEAVSHQTPSPSSVMDARAIEDNGSSETEEFKEPKQTERFKVPVLHPSMPMSDLMSHIGHCISEQMTSGNGENREVLDEIAQYLFSDSQFTSTSDEQSLMKKVNSLCCLLQNPKDEGGLGVEKGRNSGQLSSVTAGKPTCEDVQGSSEGDSKNDSGGKQLPAIPRKDSLGDLLLHLPRIASLPQFLFNISEKSDSEAR